MRAEAITRTLGGQWHGSYGTARCPAHDDRSPSLSLKDGRDGEMLLHCFAGCEFHRIRDALSSRLALSPSAAPATEKRAGQGDTAKAWLVDKLWAQSRAIGGSQAERYLRARGITGPLAMTLRFHAGLRHPAGHRLPAMLARVDQVDDRRSGLHRTYLDPVRPRKANCNPAKMMLGTCKGGAVHLREGRRSLTVAEGIETALSVGMGLEPGAELWAALSTSGMSGLILPDPAAFGRTLLIAMDGDRAGRDAGSVLAERAAARGRRSTPWAGRPPGTG